MKTDIINLTVEELNELCLLYMECKLTVLEEKELEYLLSLSPVSSPEIEEVRSLIGIRLPQRSTIQPKVRSKWRFFTGIAASVAILLSVGFYLFRSAEPVSSSAESAQYMAAYSHGRRLDGREAENATINAMAKADSLMYYASLMERDCMMKAEDIISETFNN